MECGIFKLLLSLAVNPLVMLMETVDCWTEWESHAAPSLVPAPGESAERAYYSSTCQEFVWNLCHMTPPCAYCEPQYWQLSASDCTATRYMKYFPLFRSFPWWTAWVSQVSFWRLFVHTQRRNASSASLQIHRKWGRQDSWASLTLWVACVIFMSVQNAHISDEQNGRNQRLKLKQTKRRGWTHLLICLPSPCYLTSYFSSGSKVLRAML